MIDYYEPQLDLTLLGCGFLGECFFSEAKLGGARRMCCLATKHDQNKLTPGLDIKVGQTRGW